jgi:hypothetical protein
LRRFGLAALRRPVLAFAQLALERRFMSFLKASDERSRPSIYTQTPQM